MSEYDYHNIFLPHLLRDKVQRFKGETLASWWRPDSGRGSFQLFLVLENNLDDSPCGLKTARPAILDRSFEILRKMPACRARSLRLALEVCQGKHLRNTDTHVQQPSDKITSKAKQVRQAADAAGGRGGCTQRCRRKDRQGAPLRRQETGRPTVVKLF